jgi:dTDP-L-rhamnose 4-epimerase
MSVYGEGWYRDLDGALIGDARRDPAALASGDWEVRDAEGRPLMPVATDETKPPDVASIYALTKFMQERAVLIFGAAYGVEAVALRLFNVYGAGQALSNPYTGVLSNFAARVANGRPPLVFEDGLQQRDFVHVRDVARAFRLALQSPEAAGAVLNIGSGRAQRIIDVARLVAAAMDRPDLAPEITGQARSGDIRNCIADISRARAVLGYDPDHTLVNAIDDFVAFVRAETPVDRADEMRRHLEARRLVS